MIGNLNGQLSRLEREKLELQNSLDEERLARERDVENLKNRIDRECSYVLDEFRNRLCDKLARYYREYLEACKKLPADKLAEYLKYVVDRVFRELSSNGISFEGDR